MFGTAVVNGLKGLEAAEGVAGVLVEEGPCAKVFSCGDGDPGDCAKEVLDTMTSVDAVVLPAELVAVRTYTVLDDGVTALLPLMDTLPMPWSILTEDAPFMFHLRTEFPPGEIVDGSAVNTLIIGFSLVVVTEAGALRHPKDITVMATKMQNKIRMLHWPPCLPLSLLSCLDILQLFNCI